MSQRKYHYQVFPAAEVLALFAVRPDVPADAFISADKATEAIQAALTAGFRWVRTDGEHAIFEAADEPAQ